MTGAEIYRPAVRPVRCDPPANNASLPMPVQRSIQIFSFSRSGRRRETLNVDLPDWVGMEKIYENDHVNEQGESRHRVVSINPYFQQHPEMVTGRAGDRVRPVWTTACMQALIQTGI